MVGGDVPFHQIFAGQSDPPTHMKSAANREKLSERMDGVSASAPTLRASKKSSLIANVDNELFNEL